MELVGYLLNPMMLTAGGINPCVTVQMYFFNYCAVLRPAHPTTHCAVLAYSRVAMRMAQFCSPLFAAIVRGGALFLVSRWYVLFATLFIIFSTKN